MKKITLLLFLLTASLGFSQIVVLEDFENMYPGGDLNNFEGTSSASIVADPAPGGTNGNVLEIISEATGNPWQGASMLMQNNFIDLTGGTPTIQLDIYSTSSFGMLVAAENPSGSAPRSAGDDDTNIDYVGGSGWQTITVTLNQSLDTTVPANGEYELLAFFPGWNNATNGWVTGAPGVGVPNVVYIDNIRGVQGSAIGPSCTDGVMNGDETGVDCGGSCPNACPNPPSAPPADPPARDAMTVKSIYSNAYTNEATDGFQTFGGAVVTGIDFSGNEILQSTTPNPGAGLQYQFFGVGRLDLSAQTHAHVDIYWEGDASGAGNVFQLIVQQDNGDTTVTNIIQNVDVTTLASNTWHQIDVAFNDFTVDGMSPRNNVQQVILQIAGPAAYGPFYIDNLYFHQNSVLSTDDFETAEFKVFPNPTNGDWNLTSSNTINSVAVFDILGKQVLAINPNSNEATINGSSLKTGVYFAKIEGVNGSKTVKLVRE